MNNQQLTQMAHMAETMYCHYDQLLQQPNLPAFAIEIYTERQQFWAALHAFIVPLETVCPFVKSLNNYS